MQQNVIRFLAFICSTIAVNVRDTIRDIAKHEYGNKLVHEQHLLIKSYDSIFFSWLNPEAEIDAMSNLNTIENDLWYKIQNEQLGNHQIIKQRNGIFNGFAKWLTTNNQLNKRYSS